MLSPFLSESLRARRGRETLSARLPLFFQQLGTAGQLVGGIARELGAPSAGFATAHAFLL